MSPLRLRLLRDPHGPGGSPERGSRTAPATSAHSPGTPGPLPAPRGCRGSPLPCGHPRGTEPRSSPGLTGFQQGAESERQQHGGMAAHDRGCALPPLGLCLAFSSFSCRPGCSRGAAVLRLEPVGARQVLYSPGPARHPLRPRGTPGSRGAARTPRSSPRGSSGSSARGEGKVSGTGMGEGVPGGVGAAGGGSGHSGTPESAPGPRTSPGPGRCFKLHGLGRIQDQSQVFT